MKEMSSIVICDRGMPNKNLIFLPTLTKIYFLKVQLTHTHPQINRNINVNNKAYLKNKNNTMNTTFV